MASASISLIRALRVTASRLEGRARYQWGHMGECNCGHLAQTVTHRSRGEIHASALEREGDWQQQVREYCPTSGLLIDDIITQLFELGLSRGDLGRLERLSDPDVLAGLPGGKRHLRRNRREDVILYLRTWAELLEGRLVIASSPHPDPAPEGEGERGEGKSAAPVLEGEGERAA